MSTTSESTPTPDPIVAAYGLYERKGTILFVTKQSYGYGYRRRKYFAYNTTHKTLRRVYSGSRTREVPHTYWTNRNNPTMEHIRSNHLEPIIPNDMKVDIGF